MSSDIPWSADILFGLPVTGADPSKRKKTFDIESLISLVRKSWYPSCLVDPGGRIAAWNDPLSRITGLRSDEIENEFLWDGFARLCPPREEARREAVEETARDALRTGETDWLEHDLSGRMIAADGARLTVDAAVSVLPTEGGSSLGIAFVPRVTTEGSSGGGSAAAEVLRQLNRRLEEERERERQRIARELHDELGHTLTALKMDVVRICERFAREPETRDDLLRVAGYVDEAIATVRRVASELRPGILDDLGLPAAVEWQAEEFTERTGIEVRVDVFPLDLTVESECAIGLFRILQEALTNVARHAHATAVRVTLRATDESVELIVADNGRGIDRETANTRSSHGLVGVRERARNMNGMAYVRGVPGEGTTVHVRLPLDVMEGVNEED